MIAVPTLKDYKVLVLQGKSQELTDIHQPLQDQGAEVTSTARFEEFNNHPFDLIIVDYSISEMAGILLYKKANKLSSYCLIPAIFIADTKSYDHRLNAFEMGAADFISRPFDSLDFIKKCCLHLENRRRIAEDQSIHIGNLRLYPATQSVFINNELVNLTQLEYKVLHCLLSSSRLVVSREELYAKVWGSGVSTTGRLDTQLYNLKKKILKFTGKIKSVNKVGMRILPAESTFCQEQRK